MRPAPRAGAAEGAGGLSMRTGSSSSLKMRSEEAIAACRMLNFSDMSEMGRKKRCEYRMNAMSDPSVNVPLSTQRPPNQMINAEASAPTISIAG